MHGGGAQCRALGAHTCALISFVNATVAGATTTHRAPIASFAACQLTSGTLCKHTGPNLLVFSFFVVVAVDCRMFGAACNGCGETIPSDELVMRTTSHGSNNQQQPPPMPAGHPQPPIQHFVFHIKCFRCSKCSAMLRAGDR